MSVELDHARTRGERRRLRLLDLSPARADVVGEALAGLKSYPKTLPSKLLYDAAGSDLFERITELDAYYPTRTELSVLESKMGEIGARVGPDAWIIELGSGSGRKTRLLLRGLTRPRALTLIDISRSALVDSARQLAGEFPELEVTGVVGDYTRPLELPARPHFFARKVAFFPGSTLGNFSPPEAIQFLRRLASRVGSGGGLLLGLDRIKDPAVLARAYDDEEGVTARFNLNLLARLATEGADIDPGGFRHEARWVPEARRIEMHLVSTRGQVVRVGGEAIAFREGESICTEHCHKFDEADIERMAAEAGFRVDAVFSDPLTYFSVAWLVAR